MNNSRLPIDVCEQIIDLCRGFGFPWWLDDSYETWCRSALVCSAWCPRSQYNLLREVVFKRTPQVALLIRTLLDRPHLAKLVRTVGVSPFDAPVPAYYIPFAQAPLPQLLENCVTLNIIRIAWDHYPPIYADIGLYPWKNITDFSVTLTPSTATSIWRYIWSLPMLRKLDLSVDGRRWHSTSETPTIIQCIPKRMPQDPCKNLRVVSISQLYGPNTSRLVPRGGIGIHITALVTYTLGSQLSDPVLECIQMAQRLETLELRAAFYRGDSSDVLGYVPAKKALEYVTSTDVFQTFHIDIWAPRSQYYYANRDGMLDILCREDIVASLLRFPMLRLFQITLGENDPRYGETWWTKQVALRCPEELRSVVSVKVHFKSWLSHRLWYTRTQLELADRLDHAKHRALVDKPVKDDSVLVWHHEASAGPQHSPSYLSTLPESDIAGRTRRRWSTNDMRFPKPPLHWYQLPEVHLRRRFRVSSDDLLAPSRTRAVLHGASSHPRLP
ncbi:hypothetical protein C8Q76DRAFT_761030 [Earliella scabrosa]|nr:hypothetical protein C8Q76DRAFT_761030 [Earliella scabrosa]